MKKKRKSKKKLLARLHERGQYAMFYTDGTYRYGNWAAGRYSFWTMNKGVLMYRHDWPGTIEWKDWQAKSKNLSRMNALVMEKMNR